MNEKDILNEAGIKPTAARIMVLRTMLGSGRPLSMSEIADMMETVDKSVISRTLALFRDARLLHVIEDAGAARYEVCSCHGEHPDSDSHVHFHCECCGKTFCFEDLQVPVLPLRDGFTAYSANHIIKGLCPDCAKKTSGASGKGKCFISLAKNNTEL